jgi:hypothetical protein
MQKSSMPRMTSASHRGGASKTPKTRYEDAQSMIRKSGNRFSEKIMLKQQIRAG